MNLALIVGSHRPQAESLKVGKFIQKRITALDSSIKSELVELGGNPLPLWDESIWQGSEEWKNLWTPFSEKLNRADGFVVISPEWGGMVPPALKNFFLLCSKQELSHKPGMIVTVSAGLNGAYPVSELRSSSYKNNQLCYIPEHVIVRNVTKNLNNSEKPDSTEDEYIRGRIDHALKILFSYTNALKMVREQKVHDFKKYPFGM